MQGGLGSDRYSLPKHAMSRPTQLYAHYRLTPWPARARLADSILGSPRFGGGFKIEKPRLTLLAGFRYAQTQYDIIRLRRSRSENPVYVGPQGRTSPVALLFN
jgi:hypothetical protein